MLRTTLKKSESFVLRSLLEKWLLGGGVMACLLSFGRSLGRLNALDYYIYPNLLVRKLLMMLSLARNRGEPDSYLVPYPRSDGLSRGRPRKGVIM